MTTTILTTPPTPAESMAAAMSTLLSAMEAHRLRPFIQYQSDTVLTVRTGVRLPTTHASPHPVHSALMTVVEAHGVVGAAVSGGALSYFPLKGGSVLSLTWIGFGDNNDQSALLNIANMSNAW